jgi:hypothetical protein
MASIINALTASGGGVAISGDATGNLSLQSAGNTAVTIDTSQNVGVGTTSPSAKFHVSSSSNTPAIVQASNAESYLKLTSTGGSSYIGTKTNSIEFLVNNAGNYAGSFDTSGNFLVGATSAATPTGVTSKFVSQGTFTGSNFGAAISSTAATGVDHYYISFQTATTTQRGYIYYNNGAGQVQLSATSDARLKENIVDAPLALPILTQVKVRQYDWKDTGNTNIGFVAQELYEVIPRAVSVGKDNEDGTIQRTWGVDNGTLVPYLVKAIQELNAKVEAQAAEIAVLKGVK